jgi:hypothetical protein
VTGEAKDASPTLFPTTPPAEASSMNDGPAQKSVSPHKSQPISKMGETDADIDYDDSKVCLVVLACHLNILMTPILQYFRHL